MATSPHPGLRLRAAPGHRTGHSIVEVGDSFVLAADAFHHPLHVEHPEWDTQSDSDPETRPRDQACDCSPSGPIPDATLVVSHIAGSGRIERAGGGYRWVPVDE